VIKRRLFPAVILLAVVSVKVPQAWAAPYGASYSPNQLTCMTPGQVLAHPIKVSNSGDLNWSTPPFSVSYHWHEVGVRTAVIWEGERTALPNAVGGGKSILAPHASVMATVRAPSVVGDYVLKWDMVQEGVTWFSGQGVPTGDQKVAVQSSCLATLTSVCKEIGCLCVPSPKLESLVLGSVTPGGILIIKGCGFGVNQGQAFLTLENWNSDFALFGEAKPRPLEVLEWHPTFIGAKVPEGISGVLDQQAKLQIKSQFGWSNELTVNFVATKELVKVPSDLATVLSCGTDSNADSCNDWTDPDDGDAFFASGCEATFCGSHYNCWGCIGNDTGVDIFAVEPLNNTWVLESMTPWKDQTGGVVVLPSNFPAGANSWTPTVSWSVTPNDDVYYNVHVTASGPVGVPPLSFPDIFP
jgi:hypothetical protein